MGQWNKLRNNLSKRIAIIRNAFAEVDENFERADYGIVSVPGVGYRWEPDSLDQGSPGHK